jgi:hypothetical protein
LRLVEMVKRGESTFAIRCRPPLSPFVAFGICLSSLDRKLGKS